MKLAELLTLINNFLVLVTLIILVWQVNTQRRTNQLTALDNAYNSFREISRLLIEYPSLQKYAVRGEAYAPLLKLDEDELRKRAYIEMIVDSHEQMFLRLKARHYEHEDDYLRSLLSNEHVRHYWKNMRGSYRKEFVTEVERILASLPDSGARA